MHTILIDDFIKLYLIIDYMNHLTIRKYNLIIFKRFFQNLMTDNELLI